MLVCGKMQVKREICMLLSYFKFCLYNCTATQLLHLDSLAMVSIYFGFLCNWVGLLLFHYHPFNTDHFIRI